MIIQPIQPNKPQPTFGNKIYQYTKSTSYSRCIHGQSRGFDYDVYVVNDEKKINKTGHSKASKQKKGQ